MEPIHVYVPNLALREDRRRSIKLQFLDKHEFSLHVVTPQKAETASKSLWLTFIECLTEAYTHKYDYFIFAEDDHCFTEAYNFQYLSGAISHAINHDADLLSGGVSWVELPVQMPNRDLFCFNSFTGMQFTVIFKQAYLKILGTKESVDCVTDQWLSKILDRKLVMYPYISVQKEFGYSDVTTINNTKHRVEKLFEKAEKTLHVIDKVNTYFVDSKTDEQNILSEDEIADFKISTYIIHLPERIERQKLYNSQFADRKEFDIVSTSACKHQIGAVGLWNSICRAVSKAKNANEDAVLICEDDHIFTEYYTKDSFVRKVYEAATYGAELLSGGIGGFGNAIPVANGLFWVDWLWCTQFIVIYSQAYDKILEAEFSEKDVADEFLSKILVNKMVIYPFISEQMDLGYSDVTASNNENGKITRHFEEAKSRMERIQKMTSWIQEQK